MGLGSEGDAVEEIQQLVHVGQHVSPSSNQIYRLSAGNDIVCRVRITRNRRFVESVALLIHILRISC